MKPSEQVEEIRTKLITDDYVQFGGNQYSRAMWLDKCEMDDQYRWKALMLFLDEKFS